MYAASAIEASSFHASAPCYIEDFQSRLSNSRRARFCMKIHSLPQVSAGKSLHLQHHGANARKLPNVRVYSGSDAATSGSSCRTYGKNKFKLLSRKGSCSSCDMVKKGLAFAQLPSFCKNGDDHVNDSGCGSCRFENNTIHGENDCKTGSKRSSQACHSLPVADIGISEISHDITFDSSGMWDGCISDSRVGFDTDLINLEGSFASSDSIYTYCQPETAPDPVSQLVYHAAVGKNMQWWRFLLYCKAHLSSVFGSSKSINYSLISKTYNRVFVRKVGLAPPSFLLRKQKPLSNPVRHISHELVSYFRTMGSRYGGSLLCLLFLGYWIQGFRCFPWLATSYHLKDGLRANPATLQLLLSTVNLPMTIKPVYGIVSDAVYIRGQHRIPYLMIAAALQFISWTTIAVAPAVRYSMAPLMGFLLLSNTGAAIAEVVNDALVAESVQKETGRSKGELQSFAWLALAAGGMLGNLTGGMALSKLSSKAMFAVFSVLMAGQLVASSFVKEDTPKVKALAPTRATTKLEGRGRPWEIVKEQAMKLMELVSKPEIAKPLAWFTASYALIPALGGSLFFYQTQHLKIHPTYLGFAKVLGQMGLLAGSVLYNKYFKKSSPRKMIMALQILLSVCMLSDIFLVSRLNIKFGIPDRLYILGASAFVEAVAQLKVLPFTILLTQLCPVGNEASLLGFFMSCHCLATILSGYAGTILASFLNISIDNFSGLPLGILIQALAALIPLLWISCIPSNANANK